MQRFEKPTEAMNAAVTARRPPVEGIHLVDKAPDKAYDKVALVDSTRDSLKLLMDDNPLHLLSLQPFRALGGCGIRAARSFRLSG